MNPHRGEITAEIAGAERRLRLSFEALAAIEGALGTGIIDVAERFPARTVGTQEVFIILQEALKAGGETVGESDLSKAITEMGFMTATRLAGRVLAAGLGTGEGSRAAPLAPDPPASGHSPGGG